MTPNLTLSFYDSSPNVLTVIRSAALLERLVGVRCLRPLIDYFSPA